MTQKFSKEEAFSFGWRKMKENFWFLLSLLLIILVIELSPNIIVYFFKGGYVSTRILINLIAWALKIIVSIGIIKIFIDMVDGKKSEIADLFKSYKLFFNYFLSSLIYGIMVLFGLILFIVPGIILGIKYKFFAYFIVEKGADPMEALAMSSRATKGAGWNLFLFGLLSFIINIAGLLCLGIGLLVTIPITSLANTFVYRKLSQQMGDEKK